MVNLIYHYASPKGIFDIFNDEALHFTDCQYLNDKSEIIYIREPFEKAWFETCRKHNIEFDVSDINYIIRSLIVAPYQFDEVDYDEVLKSINKDFDDLVKKYTKTYRYYVFSCSKHKDASNMWNYFIKNGTYQGYNLGINSSFLEQKLIDLCNDSSEIEVLSNDVVYNYDEQVNMIINEMDEIIADKSGKLFEIFTTNEIIPDAKIKFGIYKFINDHKLFYKNPAFENEKEYRFVLKINNDYFINSNKDCSKPLKLEYRVGASGIITPFVEWRFELLDEKQQLFKEITLSPMIEPELAKESFNRFLSKKEYRNIAIEQSSIKLRF